MSGFIARTRFATLVAVGLVLLLSGVAVGAAGGPLIMGAANSAGTTNTSLTTGSSGTALLVTQNGSGTALRGSTGSGSGIAGFFTSGSGSGISGVVGSATTGHFGVYAETTAGAPGDGQGAALRAKGNDVRGIVATSTDQIAIEANSGNGAGVYAKGTGFTGSVFGDATGQSVLAGVVGTAPTTLDGLFGGFFVAGTTGATGVLGQSTNGTGVVGDGVNGGSIDTDSWDFSGGGFTGGIGAIGQTDGFSPNGWSRGVLGISNGGVYGVASEGDALVNGDLFVSGTCSGCTLAINAVNGSKAQIHQGDALTLVGVTTAPDGSTILSVAAAKKNDAIIGIADRALSPRPETAKTSALSSKKPVLGKGVVDVETTPKTVKVREKGFREGGTSIAAGGYLRVITSGIYTYKPSATPSLSVGDALAVDATAGKLTKAGADVAKGATAGKYLGALKDGRIAILVGAN
jgi:hypothetical protein